MKIAGLATNKKAAMDALGSSSPSPLFWWLSQGLPDPISYREDLYIPAFVENSDLTIYTPSRSPPSSPILLQIILNHIRLSGTYRL